MVLRGETSQGLLDLTCYSLIIHLQRLLDGAVLLVFLPLTLLLVVALLLTVVLVFIFVLLVDLFGSCLNIHLISTDALTLTALASCFLLTLLATFFLRLLLRTRALIQGVEVNLTYYIQLSGRLHEVTRCLCQCRLVCCSNGLLSNILVIIVFFNDNRLWLFNWLGDRCLSFFLLFYFHGAFGSSHGDGLWFLNRFRSRYSLWLTNLGEVNLT